jgi:pilus assembly protein CpaD
MLQRNALPLIAIALLASACAPMGASWSPAQSPKQIGVHMNAESYVVKLDRHGRSLPKGEAQELNDYLRSLGDLSTVAFSLRRTHRGESVAALVPVEKALIAHGADPHKITRLNEIGVDYHGQWADVEIIAKRYVASMPACPDWSRPDTAGNNNDVSSNFGCATASSLALSVADPRDLEHGRTLGPAPGTTAAAAVDRYNNDKVKELSQTSTRTAN